MKPTLFIGIDPGVNTGFAVWLRAQQKFAEIGTLNIHSAMQYIKEIKTELPDNTIYVRFEDARQRKWFGQAGREKLMGAGSIKRDCTIWEDYLTDLKSQGIIVGFDMVAPKDNMTKLTSKSFKQITKWDKPTNEHGRDAACLIYGK